jgi:hypothetical protein
MKNALIYLIFFMGFIGGGLIEYGILPVHFKMLSEIGVYGLFVYSLIVSGKSRKPYQTPLLPLWLCLLFVAIISASINGYFNLKSISSLRFIFRFYIFYIALINLDIDEKSLLKINKVLFVLFLIQIPVVAYKFTIFGVSERTIGSYAARGGGLTTMMPIVMVSYFMSFYYYFKRSNWFILFSACFIMWGVVGAKAALFFLFPLNFICLYYLMVIRSKGYNFLRDLRIFSLVGVFSVCVMAIFLYAQPRMNPDREIGGRIDFRYALEFAERYETATHPEDENVGIGRVATTKVALNQVVEEGFFTLLFGYGPGTLTPTPFGSGKVYDKRVINIASGYGISGAVYIFVEYGIIGAGLFFMIFIGFLRHSWVCFNNEKSDYWKAFSSGTVVFCLLNLVIFSTYNILPVTDETLLPVFYYAMAIMHIRSSKDQTRDMQKALARNANRH